MSKFRIYKDTARQWRWAFVADNGKTVAVSSESYHNENDARTSIALVQVSSASVIVEPMPASEAPTNAQPANSATPTAVNLGDQRPGNTAQTRVDLAEASAPGNAGVRAREAARTDTDPATAPMDTGPHGMTAAQIGGVNPRSDTTSAADASDGVETGRSKAPRSKASKASVSRSSKAGKARRR